MRVVAATFMVALALCAHAESEAVDEQLASIERAILRGATDEAIDAGRTAIAGTGDLVFAKLRIARAISDRCAAALAIPCAIEFGTLALDLDMTIASNPDSNEFVAKAPQDRREATRQLSQQYAHADWLERLIRLSLLTSPTSTVKPSVERLEALATSTFAAPDMVRVYLTLAQARMAMNDVGRAAEHLESAWMTLVSDSSVFPSQATALYLPQIAQLFRATGQVRRAAELVVETAGVFSSLEQLGGGEGIVAGTVMRSIFADLNNTAAIARSASIAIDVLPRAHLPQNLSDIISAEAWADKLYDCLVSDTSECKSLSTLHEDLDHLLSSDQWYGNIRKWSPSALAVAAASALSAAKLGREAHPRVWEIVNDEKSTLTEQGAARLLVDEQTLRYVAHMALTIRSDLGAAQSFARRAARAVVARERERETANPFDVAAINTYSRMVLSLAATAIGGSHRNIDDDALLLEIVSLLNRTPLSLESEMMVLAGRLTSAEARRSLIGTLQIARRRDQLYRNGLRKLIERESGGKGRAPQQDRMSLYLKLEQLQRLYSQNMRELRPSLVRSRSREIDDLRHHLRAGEVFVTNAVLLGGGILRLCIVSDEARVKLHIGASVGDFGAVEASLVQGAIPSPGQEPVFPLKAAASVARLLLGQGAECLDGARQIVYAPSFLLPSIPLAALPDPRWKASGESSAPLASVPWIGTQYAVMQVVDSRAFVALRARGAAGRVPKAFLGVGDPALRSRAEELDGASPQFRALTQLDELPETADELRAVRAALGGEGVLLTRERATELEFRRLILANYAVISFATHAAVTKEMPNLDEPALVLTPQWKGRYPFDDGLLTASEIAELDLNASLVILSACKTAIHDIGTFGPEANSLASAFLLAGARSAMASIWPVNSEATKRLMERVAQQYAIRGRSRASEALQAAMRDFVADPVPTFRHPRFWAAFVILGDGAWSDTSSADRNAVAIDVVENEPRLEDGDGELASATQLGPVTIVSGVRHVRGRERVAGVMYGLDQDGKKTWEISNYARSFVVSDRTSGPLAPLIAWHYAHGQRTTLEWTQVSSAGMTTKIIPIEGEVEEAPRKLVFVQDGMWALLSETYSEARSQFVLRLISGDGRVEAKRTIPREHGMSNMSLVARPEGFALFLSNDRAAPTADEQRKACEPVGQTDVFAGTLPDGGLVRVETIKGLSLHDAVVLANGDEVRAYARWLPCEGLYGAFDAVVELRQPGQSPRREPLAFPGIGHYPRHVFASGDEILVTGIGSRYRAAIEGRTRDGTVDRLEAAIEGQTAGQQSGACVAVYGSGLVAKGKGCVFTGSTLFLDYAYRVAEEWRFVGSAFLRPFVGKLVQ